MINPKAELFKWGPIDGRPFYLDSFVKSFVNYPKFTGVSWPDIFEYFKDDKLIFIIDYQKLRDKGEKLFKKHILDDRKLKNNYDQWFRTVKELKKFEKLVNKGIDKENLLNIFKKWDKAYLKFWFLGSLPEFSNWGGEQILKREILKFYKTNFIEIFEGLSAPEDLSFFQEEELEFMNIKLIKDKERQLEALKKHQKEYYWLRNSYGFTEVLDVRYFKDELDKISIKEAKGKIKEIKNYPKKVRARKKELIKKYKIDKKIINIGKKVSYCVWWQDLRKKFIFIANHINSEFLKSVEKVKKISFKELCYYRAEEIIDLLENDKEIDYKKRFRGFVMYYDEEKGSLICKIGRQANDFVKPYLEVKIDKSIKEFRGLVVSKGKIVRGRVKILLTPKNLNKMNKGDILVAPMTSPDFIIAMRKASAIITDEGGMTSHAAIVSRELGIPCIVGTRVASKVLEDGDRVEIDTNCGKIKIIDKFNN